MTPDSNPKTIKELALEEQPREKALRYGCGALTTAELWALILRTGVPGCNIKEMCTELMSNNENNLTVLERRSIKELCAQRGLGTTKAIQIQAVMEITRRYHKEKLPERATIRCSRDIYEVIRHDIAHKGHEEIWCILLNRRNQVIRRILITKGGITASVFDLKIILKEAILEGASGLILCHNHPSGQLQPSVQDDNITRKCKQGCEAVDVHFLDHLIVTPESYYSYNDMGRL